MRSAEGSERNQGAMATTISSVHGMAPLLGRLFVATTTDRARPTVVSASVLQRLFGDATPFIGESSISLRSLHGHRGVAEQFQLEDPKRGALVPWDCSRIGFGQRWNHAGFLAIGRLRASVTPERAYRPDERRRSVVARAQRDTSPFDHAHAPASIGRRGTRGSGHAARGRRFVL